MVRIRARRPIGSVLAEFGLVFGRSPKVLRAALPDVLEDASNELGGTARMALQQAFDHWRDLDDCMQCCDRQISQHARNCDAARRAARVIGIGKLGASAFSASVADFHQFKSGRQFGARLGIVPRQNSSGGKPSLGRITKRGQSDRQLVNSGFPDERRSSPNSGANGPCRPRRAQRLDPSPGVGRQLDAPRPGSAQLSGS